MHTRSSRKEGAHNPSDPVVVPHSILSLCGQIKSAWKQKQACRRQHWGCKCRTTKGPAQPRWLANIQQLHAAHCSNGLTTWLPETLAVAPAAQPCVRCHSGCTTLARTVPKPWSPSLAKPWPPLWTGCILSPSKHCIIATWANYRSKHCMTISIAQPSQVHGMLVTDPRPGATAGPAVAPVRGPL